MNKGKTIAIVIAVIVIIVVIAIVTWQWAMQPVCSEGKTLVNGECVPITAGSGEIPQPSIPSSSGTGPPEVPF